jgi:hypothetical protein
MNNILAALILWSYAVGATALSWFYFQRYTMSRPPLGTFNLADLVFMVVGVLLVPYLYLALPNWLLLCLIVGEVLGILYLAWEPVLRARWAIWMAAVTLLAVDAAALHIYGVTSRTYLAINNMALVVIVVAIANLWVQSGMRAREFALLTALLTTYDSVATWHMPLMDDLFTRLADFPFAPLVAWPTADGGGTLALGIGDLLIAAAAPLVMRKAFGWSAGALAMGGNIAALGFVLLLPLLGGVAQIFPVMTVLGPLFLVQFVVWRRCGRERTMWEYLQVETSAA